MGDQVDQVVALRGGVLGVGAHVEVEAGAVLEEDVAAAAPGDHPPEQVAGHLVRAETALTPERAGHSVLVLEPVDAPVHGATLGAGGHGEHRTRFGGSPVAGSLVGYGEV